MPLEEPWRVKTVRAPPYKSAQHQPLAAHSPGDRLEAADASGRLSMRFDLGEESRYLGVLTLAAA